jgi:hypothetical protein
VEDKSFDEPVRILTGRAKSVARQVRSTAEAANYLLHDWPVEGGRKHLAARKACLQVLEGLKASHVARKAFAVAAEEAEILVDGTTAHDNPLARFLAKGRR